MLYHKNVYKKKLGGIDNGDKTDMEESHSVQPNLCEIKKKIHYVFIFSPFFHIFTIFLYFYYIFYYFLYMYDYDIDFSVNKLQLLQLQQPQQHPQL